MLSFHYTFNTANDKDLRMFSLSTTRDKEELHPTPYLSQSSKAATSVPITSAGRAQVPPTTPGKTQLLEGYPPDTGDGLYARLYEKIICTVYFQHRKRRRPLHVIAF